MISSSAGNTFWDPGTWQQFADNTEYLHEGYPNTLIVQAAGNYYNHTYDPLPDMIIVGGTNKQDTRWIQNEQLEWGSVFGSMIDVMAPAVDIYSTKNASDDAYGAPSYGGTSYATPQVGGLCALIWSYDPEFSAAEVQSLLFTGCDETADYDPDLHGHGRINVFNSLALATGSLWTRDPHPGMAGEDNTFKAAGASNGATVRFYYGTATGQTQVSGCATTVVVGIANASVLGTATASSNGAAILADYFVPSGWAEQTVYLQAVEVTSCRVSNITIFTFPAN